MMVLPSAGILKLYCFLKAAAKSVTDDSVHLCLAAMDPIILAFFHLSRLNSNSLSRSKSCGRSSEYLRLAGIIPD